MSKGPVMEEWDIISPKDVIGSEQLFVERTKSLASAALPFTQSLLSQVHSRLSLSLLHPFPVWTAAPSTLQALMLNPDVIYEIIH